MKSPGRRINPASQPHESTLHPMKFVLFLSSIAAQTAGNFTIPTTTPMATIASTATVVTTATGTTAESIATIATAASISTTSATEISTAIAFQSTANSTTTDSTITPGATPSDVLSGQSPILSQGQDPIDFENEVVLEGERIIFSDQAQRGEEIQGSSSPPQEVLGSPPITGQLEAAPAQPRTGSSAPQTKAPGGQTPGSVPIGQLPSVQAQKVVSPESALPAGSEEGTSLPSGSQQGTVLPAGSEGGTVSPSGPEQGTSSPSGSQQGTVLPAGSEGGTVSPSGPEQGSAAPGPSTSDSSPSVVAKSDSDLPPFSDTVSPNSGQTLQLPGNSPTDQISGAPEPNQSPNNGSSDSLATSPLFLGIMTVASLLLVVGSIVFYTQYRRGERKDVEKGIQIFKSKAAAKGEPTISTPQSVHSSSKAVVQEEFWSPMSGTIESRIPSPPKEQAEPLPSKRRVSAYVASPPAPTYTTTSMYSSFEPQGEEELALIPEESSPAVSAPIPLKSILKPLTLSVYSSSVESLEGLGDFEMDFSPYNFDEA